LLPQILKKEGVASGKPKEFRKEKSESVIGSSKSVVKKFNSVDDSKKATTEKMAIFKSRLKEKRGKRRSSALRRLLLEKKK